MQFSIAPLLLSEKGRYEYHLATGQASRWAVWSRRGEHLVRLTKGCLPAIAVVATSIFCLYIRLGPATYDSMNRTLNSFTAESTSHEILGGLLSLPSVVLQELGRDRGGITKSTGTELIIVALAAVESIGLLKKFIPGTFKYSESEFATDLIGLWNPQEMARQVYSVELRMRYGQVITTICLCAIPIIAVLLGSHFTRPK